MSTESLEILCVALHRCDLLPRPPPLDRVLVVFFELSRDVSVPVLLLLDLDVPWPGS